MSATSAKFLSGHCLPALLILQWVCVRPPVMIPQLSLSCEIHTYCSWHTRKTCVELMYRTMWKVTLSHFTILIWEEFVFSRWLHAVADSPETHSVVVTYLVVVLSTATHVVKPHNEVSEATADTLKWIRTSMDLTFFTGKHKGSLSSISSLQPKPQHKMSQIYQNIM